jgi:hypothetical protein
MLKKVQTPHLQSQNNSNRDIDNEKVHKLSQSKNEISTNKISVSNWSNLENEYQEKRNSLLRGATSAEVIGAPFVYSDRQMLTASLTRIDLFKKVLEVQGAIVECGVHKANSLFLYYHLSSILEPYNFNRQIIGFDTTEGFRSLSSNDDNKLLESDFSVSSFQSILAWAKLQDLNRAVSHITKI